MVKKELRIPHNKDGNMLQWDHDYNAVSHRPNSIWIDGLIYLGYGRGRSAAYFLWRSVFTNREYYMFISDMNDVLLSTDMMARIIKAQFTYVKRGQNFGIKMVGDYPDDFENRLLGEL